MAIFRKNVKKQHREYTPVSVDGSAVLSAAKVNTDVLIKKAEKAAASINSEAKEDSENSVKSEFAVLDRRVSDGEDVIKEFLKLDRSFKLTYPFVVNKFIELIANYTKLYQHNAKLQTEYSRIRDGVVRSLQDAPPQWN